MLRLMSLLSDCLTDCQETVIVKTTIIITTNRGRRGQEMKAYTYQYTKFKHKWL